MKDMSYGEMFEEFIKGKSHEDLAKSHISLIYKRDAELNKLLNEVNSDITDTERIFRKSDIDITNEKTIIISRLHELRNHIKQFKENEE